MGSINNSHHEQTGGVCIFNGELILLYCDAVNCEIEGKASVKGRIYLTTHRIVFTATPLQQSAVLKSFSAPFYAMFDLNLEQPIFGANYIKGKVRGEGDTPNFVFKLKFNKGGAIEFGQAMSNAAKLASNAATQQNFQPPPPYTPTASSFYQAPDTVYQPGYPVGFVLPVNVFPDAPPPGFIYMTQAPPPYPGLNTTGSQPNYANASNYQTPGYSSAPSAPGFNAANEQPPSYDEATKKAQ
ncbi:WW domain-binding protein 2-like protein [Dinothrombium tinctorium]|uniref:WW domain-binding protein 2-like protein n=1 Tax=Dinothrombium tinctorium TaxID=1965070 RepID=A0A443RKH7_9ACAR|nr:WW domain-binding protein 2-like protein [Dinothrombium tinctorium]